MTAQINDTFQFRGDSFAVAGISEGEIFDPSELGLEPLGVTTATSRGFKAVFTLVESHLVLKDLYVFLDVIGPELCGVVPTPPQEESYTSLYDNQYESLYHRLFFAGRLLLASEFIWDLYVHSGFHPAWKYKKVMELTFNNGTLMDVCDRSQRMAEIRRDNFVESFRWRLFARKPGVGKDYSLPEGSYTRGYQL